MPTMEEILRTIVAEQIAPLKKALEDTLEARKRFAEDDVWLTVGQAKRLIGCDQKHVYKLIDTGFLSLSFLPGTDRGDKRISKNEVLELKEKFTILKRSRL